MIRTSTLYRDLVVEDGLLRVALTTNHGNGRDLKDDVSVLFISYSTMLIYHLPFLPYVCPRLCFFPLKLFLSKK